MKIEDAKVLDGDLNEDETIVYGGERCISSPPSRNILSSSGHRS
jgi:hypothetical protein